MLGRTVVGIVFATSVFGCARSDPQANAETQASSARAAVAAPPVSASAASGASASASGAASAAAPDVGTPKRVERGDGITITETTDGRITVNTTTLWNEALDTTYASCDYYRGAVPVLKRQLTSERGKLLEKFCDADKPTKSHQKSSP